VKAVPYLRVSTDDKGQDPERQMLAIRAWAQREGVELLQPVVDSGTSASKTNPLDREAFIEALERARRSGADAIVVETEDRFSRQGTKLAGWAEIEMEQAWGVKLWRADISLRDHDEVSGEIVSAVRSVLARAWARQHSRRVREGLARRAERGQPVGRAPKELTDAEVARAAEMRAAGRGWPSIGVDLSAMRGAHEVADPAARRERMVSGRTVQRFFERRGIPDPAGQKTGLDRMPDVSGEVGA